MKLRSYWNLLKGKTKTIKPAKLTVRNVLAVIQALWRKNKSIAGFDLPVHVYEQIIWRRFEVARLSPECWNSGSCKVCGCEILGKTMEDRECSAGEINLPLCYPAMMKAEDWNTYKQTHNIKLFE